MFGPERGGWWKKLYVADLASSIDFKLTAVTTRDPCRREYCGGGVLTHRPRWVPEYDSFYCSREKNRANPSTKVQLEDPAATLSCGKLRQAPNSAQAGSNNCATSPAPCEQSIKRQTQRRPAPTAPSDAPHSRGCAIIGADGHRHGELARVTPPSCVQ